ncbi:zonadhesin-like [Discoglossus pictus]
MQSGQYVIVDTDFGLQLQFNGDHELFVKVKETYKGTLCGLCGTYNDNRHDDFTIPNGTVVSNVNEFGNSWRFPDDEWICDSITPDPPTCSPSIQQVGEKKCWVLRDANGPFRQCHKYLHPHEYFQSCVFDHCATGGNEDLLCNVLESYAAACEAFGVSLGHWKNDTVCDPNRTTESPPSSSPDSSFTTPATTTISSRTPTPGDNSGFAICSASGDPHYNTFDGAVHHYMGNCSYTLSKLCNVSYTNLSDFHVYTTNEYRGSNTKVSYVQSVHIEVYNNEFTLLKNKRLNVNGKRTNPPFTKINWFTAHISGIYLVFETDFGLRVKFDGNHYVDVTLPPIYKGLICGLCGNYNGISTDDSLMPNGNLATNSKEFGDSWLVADNNKLCGSEDLDTCDPQLIADYSKDTVCGIISDPEGIFKDCHALVPPHNFFENCWMDMCFTEGASASLCYAVQSYAEQCANAGVCVEWRSQTFCPISCPGGSHYEYCGTGCPATCSDRTSLVPCMVASVEGCVCNEGYILSGDRCVLESECGCTDQHDNFYQLGESWFTYENCSQRCTCDSNNNIICSAWACGVLESCQIKDGVLGCHSSGTAACQVSGDPHYFTFDHVMHNFMGTCTYILVKVCDLSNVIPVTISGKNEDRGQRTATYLKEIYIDIYNTRITLQKGKITLIDNNHIQTPWTGHANGISVGSVGIYTVVETDFGMRVKFDGNHHLEIILPDSYYGKVCGMCGNYNDLQQDELLMPNGFQAVNETQFGNSWRSEADSDTNCLPDIRDDLSPPCSASQRPVIENQCNVLLSDTFRECHFLIDPNPFVESCVYDMCRYDGMLSTLCAITQGYVDACRTKGINIKWRTSKFCPLACPSHSHYTDCATLCPPTCNNIFAPAVCDKPVACMEGCACDDGYVLSGDKCVPLSQCGCRDSKDNYYEIDESWISPHCTQKCECKKGNKIQCKNFGCDSGICSLNKQGKYNCRPTSYSKCTIAGDPHYRTFDGLMHHFQGKDSYTLSQTTSDLSDILEPFNIESRNEPLYSFNPFTIIKEMRIEVYNHVIIFKQKKVVVLDGVKILPPIRPHAGIYIYQKPTRIYLETDFGLSISFDGDQNADVILPITYKNEVRGICGNFDGTKVNDFTRPDGIQVNDVTNFGESWKVKSWKTSIRSRRDTGVKLEEDDVSKLNTGDNLACSASELSFVNSSSFCGVLRETNGPFKECHKYISPDPFVTNCLFDTCAEFRSKDLFCQNLAQYVLACQQNGSTVDSWREITGCGMPCQYNSQYKECMSACPASCSNLASETECEDVCSEGCQCNSGYVLSGYDCVPYKECGCTYLDKYYQSGEEFITNDCLQKCTCTESLTVDCNVFQCEPDEICTIANFTRGCYVPGPCLDNPCENGGTCIEDPPGKNTTYGMTCKCPETHSGFFCEAEERTYPDSVIYIVIGVIVGVLALGFFFALAAYCFLKSRKKNTGRINSNDSSESGSINLNIVYENPEENYSANDEHGAVVNFAFEEDVAVMDSDVDKGAGRSEDDVNVASSDVNVRKAAEVETAKNPSEIENVKKSEADASVSKLEESVNVKKPDEELVVSKSEDEHVKKPSENENISKSEEEASVSKEDLKVRKSDKDANLSVSKEGENVRKTVEDEAAKTTEAKNVKKPTETEKTTEEDKKLKTEKDAREAEEVAVEITEF